MNETRSLDSLTVTEVTTDEAIHMMTEQARPTAASRMWTLVPSVASLAVALLIAHVHESCLRVLQIRAGHHQPHSRRITSRNSLRAASKISDKACTIIWQNHVGAEAGASATCRLDVREHTLILVRRPEASAIRQWPLDGELTADTAGAAICLPRLASGIRGICVEEGVRVGLSMKRVHAGLSGSLAIDAGRRLGPRVRRSLQV